MWYIEYWFDSVGRKEIVYDDYGYGHIVWEAWADTTSGWSRMWGTVRSYHDKYYFLVPVGPFLLWINVFNSRVTTSYEAREYTDTPASSWLDFCIARTYTNAERTTWYDNESGMAYIDGRVASATHHEVIPATPLQPDAESHYCDIGQVFMAPYTDDLYQRALAAKSWDAIPSEFVEQTVYPGSYPTWGAALLNAIRNVDINYSMFARPHTKVELQAAGLWPS
jgi:hypothetical protein